MRAINVNTLLDDPLAAYNALLDDPGNYETFRSSIVLRLSIVTSDKISQSLANDIENESLSSQDIYPVMKEYIINELLYEFRLGKGTDPAFEKAVLKNWITKVISKHGSDAGLDFYNILRNNREGRKR